MEMVRMEEDTKSQETKERLEIEGTARVTSVVCAKMDASAQVRLFDVLV